MEQHVEEEPFYTESQERVLTFIPYISAPLSIICSSCIIYIILKKGSKKLKHMYHRLLFCISVVDVFNSLNAAMSGLLVPDSPVGSIATCELQGFLFHLSVVVGIYNGCLCLYYKLCICHQWTDRQLSKIEPYMHGLAFLYPLSFATIGVAMDLFNPMQTVPGWCFYSEQPSNCNIDEDLECVRGSNYFLFGLLGCILPVVVTTIFVLYAMIQIFFAVRHQEKRMRDLYGGIEGSSQQTLLRTRQTAIQAGFYAGAYVLTFGMSILSGILAAVFPVTPSHQSYYFVSGTLVTALLPLQGLWIFLIYARPRYRSLRIKFPSESRFSILKRVVFGNDDSVEHSSDRLAHRSTTNFFQPTSWFSISFSRHFNLPSSSRILVNLENSPKNISKEGSELPSQLATHPTDDIAVAGDLNSNGANDIETELVVPYSDEGASMQKLASEGNFSEIEDKSDEHLGAICISTTMCDGKQSAEPNLPSIATELVCTDPETIDKMVPQPETTESTWGTTAGLERCREDQVPHMYCENGTIVSEATGEKNGEGFNSMRELRK